MIQYKKRLIISITPLKNGSDRETSIMELQNNKESANRVDKRFHTKARK